MKIKAQIDVARFLRAMESRHLNIVDACAVCGVNNKTLAKILRGEFPQRIDAFYRVVHGLEIPIEEALIAGPARAPVLNLVPRRREFPSVGLGERWFK